MTDANVPHDHPAPATEAARDLSRRGVLRGTAVGALTVPVLAACGGSDTPSDGGSGGGEGGPLASTSDVPVDGGTILGDEQVVITQPTEGDFKAFTAICTHQGCVVSSVSDGAINCECHGSQFSVEDGSVLHGPATAPLEAVKITVEGDSITRA